MKHSPDPKLPDTIRLSFMQIKKETFGLSYMPNYKVVLDPSLPININAALISLQLAKNIASLASLIHRENTHKILRKLEKIATRLCGDKEDFDFLNKDSVYAQYLNDIKSHSLLLFRAAQMEYLNETWEVIEKGFKHLDINHIEVTEPQYSTSAYALAAATGAVLLSIKQPKNFLPSLCMAAGGLFFKDELGPLSPIIKGALGLSQSVITSAKNYLGFGATIE